MSADTNRPKMSAPTPETDRIALLLENLDEWIDDSLRKSKPVGLTLCAARSTIADHRARITELWDALETLRRERDEALMDRANGDIATMTINHYERILRERDMAEDERIDLAKQLRSEKERHAKCQNERDEARESLRILAGLVAYGLGQSGEEWSLEAMRQATTAIQNAKSLEAAK